MSGEENGVERAENQVERSGAVSGRCKNTMERSGALSGRSRSVNRTESGGYRNRLERGAAFSSAPLTCSVCDIKNKPLIKYDTNVINNVRGVVPRNPESESGP